MILVVDCGSTKVPDIVQCLSKHHDNVQSSTLDELVLIDENDIEAVVISGAPILLSQVDPTQYLKWIGPLLNLSVPMLGICFGHQIISLLFGGTVMIGAEQRVPVSIEKLQDNPVLNGLSQHFEMNQDHCEYATVPSEFHLLASSDLCENEAMAHKYLPVWGVQFHPEVSQSNGQLIFENFVRSIESKETE